MSRIYLDPGVYLNVFPVEIPKEPLTVMRAQRSSFPNLHSLRESLKREDIKAEVYADRSFVYGYGEGAAGLEAKGFQRSSLKLVEVPKLAARLIVEGLVNALETKGYKALPRKGRWQVYQPDQFTLIAYGNIRVHKGYDLRALFLKDAYADQLVFGLIVDIIWLFRDANGQPLNMSQIRQQHGYNVAINIGQVQGEYLPNSNRLNTEVARQRLVDHILPFVQTHSKFNLPCGGNASLLPEPIRVIIGGEER